MSVSGRGAGARGAGLRLRIGRTPAVMADELFIFASIARLLRRKVAVLVLASIVLAPWLFAESKYRGQVTFRGVPVPGVTVTASQGDVKFVVITVGDGGFTFPQPANGKWVIEVAMLGFATLKGDTSTSNWELKMLPLAEMHSELAHAVSLASTLPAASFPTSTARVDSRPQEAKMIGTFANHTSELSQLAADGVLIDGVAAKAANSSSGHPVDNSNWPVLAQPLYYGDIGIFPGISSLNAR